MKLTTNEIRAAYYAVSTCRRALAGKAVPPSVKALADRLEHVLRYVEMSPTRQQNDCGSAELEPENEMEWIGSRLAAEILGWDIRRVQRAAARGDLDCQIVGHRYVFPASAITERMEAH